MRLPHLDWKEIKERLSLAIFGLPYLWLTAFLLIPLLIVLGISFSESVIALPPYKSLLSWSADKILTLRITFENYVFAISDGLYAHAYSNSFVLALETTLLCLIVGYPIAYGLISIPFEKRFYVLLFLLIPFWTSFMVRIYAWLNLLGGNSWLCTLLQTFGILGAGEDILGRPIAILIVMVYTYIPFLILPLYNTLQKIDPSLSEAASDLGAKPHTIFFKVALPLSLRGALTGSILIFIPCFGEFAIPTLLGNGKVLMVGQIIWGEFFYNRDWPLACALAITMLLTLIPPILLFQRMQRKSLL